MMTVCLWPGRILRPEGRSTGVSSPALTNHTFSSQSIVQRGIEMWSFVCIVMTGDIHGLTYWYLISHSLRLLMDPDKQTF